VQPAGNFTYTINFENEPTATAPAQTVSVTEQLDPNLDWSTFQLGDIGFGDTVVSVPAGHTSFSTRVDATATLGVYVDIKASFNLQTGQVTWTFTSLDPQTLDLPANPLAGFLPPNANAPAGQGFVNYTVNPKPALTSGTRINAQATVVFDTNAPINTALRYNTVDSGAPSSSVSALPATETTPSFTINWSGQDDTGGSGIASYTVYVSDNGGPFTVWQNATTQTSATFNGVDGHTYAFYSVTTDNVGNQQATQAGPQASTTVQTQVATTVALTSDHSAGSTYGQTVTFTATVSAATPTAGSPTGSVQFQVDGMDLGSAITLANGTASVATSTLAAGTHSITATYSSSAPSWAN
jgi:hypothetical protein